MGEGEGGGGEEIFGTHFLPRRLCPLLRLRAGRQGFRHVGLGSDQVIARAKPAAISLKTTEFSFKSEIRNLKSEISPRR